MATIPNLDGYDTVLPADVAAERTILGSVLLDNGAYYEAAEKLETSDFSLDSHRHIFRRMGGLMDTQRPVDIVTLSNELAKHKEIGAVGGVAYLASLTEGLPRRPVIGEYIRIVKDKALARTLMTISSQAIARAADQSETALEVYSATVSALEDATASLGSGGLEIAQIIAEDEPRFEAEANAPASGTLGASLPTPNLSEATCGIQEGELCLLCARPHQGKTEAATQVIVENAKRGLRVHFFSLEMTARQITRRMARYLAEVPVGHMRDPRCLTPNERFRLFKAREELVRLPIVIDDTHELTAADFRSRSVLAAKRWKADLLVVDYAQLLLVPRAKNALEEAKKQAETLRHIARDYCRTMALAQLRRAPPNDLNKYPDIEDIYGSSAFEQAAQIILMLHRSRENKKYSHEDFCFVGKVRELQGIAALPITAESWGGFKDRDEAAQTTRKHVRVEERVRADWN
jgi:replicative DNA helicase